MTQKSKAGKTAFKRAATALLSGVLLLAGSGGVLADTARGSVGASAQGSSALLKGSATILKGSALILTAGSLFVVVSVLVVAGGVILTLKGVSEAATISLHVHGAAVPAKTVVGQVLTATVTPAGHILHSGETVIAFVPNAEGRPLNHSSTYQR